MRILFENLLLSATLSSVSPNGIYPVTNLAHPFLRKIYKSTANTDTITLSWTADQVIDSCYLGYTNATSCTLKLYSSAGVLLGTQTFTPADMAVHFTAVSGVRSATLTITASATVYLGGIGIGQSYTMPDPLNDWVDTFVDNSTSSSSSYGQVLTNKIDPLRQAVLNFDVSGYDAYSALSTRVAALSRPTFVDLFEKAHDRYLPLYCTITPSNQAKTDDRFTFTLTLLEAR
jgi:hypothetical protein